MFTIIDTDYDTNTRVHKDGCSDIAKDTLSFMRQYGRNATYVETDMGLRDLVDLMGVEEIAEESVEDGDSYGREVLWQLEGRVHICSCARDLYSTESRKLATTLDKENS